MSVDEGPIGLTYRSGESYLAADLERMPAAEPKRPSRSAVSVRVGDRGTFQTVAETPDVFDETDVELAELPSAPSELSPDVDRVTGSRVTKHDAAAQSPRRTMRPSTVGSTPTVRA